MLLHALIPASRANGPGLRAVVFFQGCSLGCKNCWNQNSHAFVGVEVSPDALADQVLKAHADYALEGVTFSGGEPMQQAEALRGLIKHLQRAAPTLSFGMFSGYAERELDHGSYWIRTSPSVNDKQLLWQEIRARLDFAVLGRFNESQPSREPLVTSRNQVLRLFSQRYVTADFGEQSVEISIDENGLTEVTGFPVLGSPF